ncbi:hypothetical protein MBGDF03_00170 [Thermoplasmatales archaeon SCGC AB-540-F20]|nr:hypothetical protein MBGDF03_00170 [Thermoplasmatales archaeon SCGC AB-540-F20]
MPKKISKEKAKKAIGKTASKTIHFTVKTVIVIFVLIIIYTIAVTILGFIKSGADFLENIATISVGGFWAFFLGYFGWRLGQTIESYLVSMKKK